MYLQHPLGFPLDMDTLTATSGALDEPLLTAPSASQSLAIRNSILSGIEAKNCGDSCFTPLFAHFLSNPSAISTDSTFKIYSEWFIVLTLPPWSAPPSCFTWIMTLIALPSALLHLHSVLNTEASVITTACWPPPDHPYPPTPVASSSVVFFLLEPHWP